MLPDLKEITEQARLALAEDVGQGDITAELIPASSHSRARLITREAAIMCGQAWANEVFAQLGGVKLEWQVREGDRLHADQTLCLLDGNSRKLLTGERTALNFLQTLMGTATTARHYADAVAGKAITVLDTRKTLPGLRNAQKYAVACGGCANHRIGLYDAFLIKENHISACGSLTGAITQARSLAPNKRVIVEVENLAELQEAIAARPDQVLLDNFAPEEIVEAQAAYAAGITVEVSGNLDLEQLPEADFPICISVGALTKHVRAIDLSLRVM
jgi:nicotinate-nucleotide pyrophosphorylase (carboxylating)